MYSYFHRALEYLENPESIFIVIGTMGNVVLIRDFIGRIFKNKYEKKVKATTILNNLEESEFLPESIFDHIYYEKATEALPKIEDFIYKNF